MASATLFMMTESVQSSVTSVMCDTAAAFVQVCAGRRRA
jgi:hypothetical protein